MHVILAGVLAAFSVFVYVSQAREVDAATTDQLSAISEQVQAYFKDNHQQLVQAGHAQLGADFFAKGKAGGPLKDVVVELIGLRGEVLQQAGPIRQAEADKLAKFWTPEETIKQRTFQMTITLPGTATARDYLFFRAVAPFADLGMTGWIVGLPVDATGQLPRLAWTLLTGSLLLLLADLWVGYWLAGRVMRPVQAITRAAREISETDLHQRLNLGAPDELGELADTFDRMLARL